MKITNSFIYIILFYVGLSGCSDKIEFTVVTPSVETYNIPKKNNEHIQRFPAVVSASDLTHLSFRISGELIEIAVHNGKKVNKGDLIAKIDPTTFKLTVKDKKAKAELAKLSMGRAQKMVALGNMAQSIVDELSAKYRVAQAEYESALLTLSYVELKAPFDGIIAAVPADNFENTTAGQLVAIMHRTDNIEIKVAIPDVILAATNPKNDNRAAISLNVKLDAYPEHTFTAFYKKHTTEQTDEEKKYILVLEMPVDQKRVALQGMPGSVEIDLDKLRARNSNTNTVPVEAVLLPDENNINSGELVVWRVKADSTVESVSVKQEGFKNSALMDVSGPLKEGDQIVVAGMNYLQNGLAVNVRETRELAK